MSRCEIDYSPPSSGEVLNGCQFIFTSHNPFIARYMDSGIFFFSFKGKPDSVPVGYGQ
jgi:hypothetical protein